MDGVSKCRSWFLMVTSFLGLLAGIAGFLIFMFTFENYQAGMLACFSGILAALCFHLYILQHFDVMESWYTPVIMTRIAVFATVVLIASLAAMAWFISNVIIKHEGFYPIETSDPVRAVMSFMNVKWAMSLLVFAVYSRRKMLRRAFAYQNIAASDESLADA